MSSWGQMGMPLLDLYFIVTHCLPQEHPNSWIETAFRVMTPTKDNHAAGSLRTAARYLPSEHREDPGDLLDNPLILKKEVHINTSFFTQINRGKLTMIS